MVYYPVLSENVLGCLQEVHKRVGPGLLEACYHKALFYELQDSGLLVSSERVFRVFYKGRAIGLYQADLVVENRLLIECKAVKGLNAIHQAQVINYLKISGLRVGYLVNFGKRYLETQRLVV